MPQFTTLFSQALADLRTNIPTRLSGLYVVEMKLDGEGCPSPANVPIGGADFDQLLLALQNNTSLTHLSLAKQHLNISQLSRLVTCLQQRPTAAQLVELDVSGNDFFSTHHRNAATINVLTNLIARSGVRQLNLSKCGLNSIDAGHIATALPNSSITSLNLRKNCIRNDGVAAIANALRQGCPLVSLNLSWNRFGNVGVRNMCEALEVNHVLQELELSRITSNPIKGYARSKEIDRLLQRNRENPGRFEPTASRPRVLGFFEPARSDSNDTKNTGHCTDDDVSPIPRRKRLSEQELMAGNSAPVRDQEEKIDRRYFRRAVAADGDCGYTAFGITRKQAFQLLEKNLNTIKDSLKPGVREALLDSGFYGHLVKIKLIKATWSHEYITKNISQFAGWLPVVQCYLRYDVRDAKLGAGWTHPCVLQALAQIQQLTLRIWELGENGLVPHRAHGQDYSYTLPNPQGEGINLLFVNGNHFERLTLVEHENRAMNEPNSCLSHDVQNTVAGQFSRGSRALLFSDRPPTEAPEPSHQPIRFENG